jgi:hypothetical protein
MTDQDFFNDSIWLGKVIRFGNSPDISEWGLEAKYNDKNDQLTAEDYNVDYINYRTPSAACGTFRCRRVQNPGVVGVLKIIMQFVYALA